MSVCYVCMYSRTEYGDAASRRSTAKQGILLDGLRAVLLENDMHTGKGPGVWGYL